MRWAYLGCIALVAGAAVSCGNPEDVTRTEPLVAPAPPLGVVENPTARNQLQLFLRYERDQHDLVKVAPGPCG
ncbi:MAG TPA: hypothetical protein VKN99_16765 [Polyangia bacterium]|nr:hypothetical protein [Polyangia bacterium]